MKTLKTLLALAVASFLLLGTSVKKHPGPEFTCTNIVTAFLDPVEAKATSDFVNLVTNAKSSGGAINVDEYVVPVNAIISDLKVSDVTDPGTAGDVWNITILDDSAPTALTCQIDNGETGCSNVTSSVAVAADSDLVAWVTSAAGSTDPDASANMRISFCITQD